MDLIFTCTAGPFSDYVNYYHVNIIEPITVKEFVDYILNKRANESGKIIANEPDKIIENKFVCSYNGNAITDNGSLDDIADIPIKSIDAIGGWSVMDYMILI